MGWDEASCWWRRETAWRRSCQQKKNIYVFLWGAAAGREKIRNSWGWVKERKTGSSWEDSWKRKKSGEQNRGTGRERERSWERGFEKGFSAKGIFEIFQVRIREHI